MFWTAGIALLLALWAFSTSGLFTVDEFFYQQMASAMAVDGRLSFTEMRLENTPAVDMVFAFPADGGRLTPQYPSGYALIVAPFYSVLGVKGLMLVNTLAAFITCVLTYGIARRLGASKAYARAAVSILVLCTFASTYFDAVWPHMISAALATAVIYLAFIGAQDERMTVVVAAGLLTGLGCAIRIDTIVLAPAVFIWARLGGASHSRRYLLFFLGGLAAGLTLPSGLNFLKFGTLNPFTYQNTMPQNDPALFLAPAAIVTIGLVFIFFVDVTRLLRSVVPQGRNRVLVAVFAAGLCVAALLSDRIRELIGGYYTFLVDQQAFAFEERLSGVSRNEFGVLIFFGVLKKALLQSAPFAAIAVLPVIRLLQGRLMSGARLLLFAAAGYVTLYALNQTDAGLAVNQRFFVPILPILSILAAIELSRMAAAGIAPARIRGFALATGFTILVSLIIANLSPSKVTYLGVLYAPLLIALAAVGFALVWERRGTRRAAVNASLALYCALGASAATAAGDLTWTLHYRSISKGESDRLSTAVPPDALVLTDRIIFWGDRASKDLSLAYWSEERRDQISGAILAFLAADRAVYAHGARVVGGLREAGCDFEEIRSNAPLSGQELFKITSCRATTSMP